jgi:hypothetical protein
MIENRYVYYSLLINMVVNVMMYVPHILIEQEFDGAMSSILLAIPVGILMMVLFTKTMQQFPKERFPEILKRYTPKWVSKPSILVFGCFSYVSGAISLLAFAELTQRYLTPETSSSVILSLYTIPAIILMGIPTRRIMFAVEILFLMNTSIIIAILVKCVTERNMDWNGIRDVVTNSVRMPQFGLIAAATYVYSGFTNLIILNGSFRCKLRMRDYVIIGTLGLTTLATSFFIPIGRLGEFAVRDYTFPWISAADSVQTQYFILERLSIPFLLVYMIVTLVQAILCWHVGLELFKAEAKQEARWPRYGIPPLFGAGIYGLYRLIPDQNAMFNFSSKWMVAWFLCEIALVAITLYLARRKRHETATV